MRSRTLCRRKRGRRLPNAAALVSKRGRFTTRRRDSRISRTYPLLALESFGRVAFPVNHVAHGQTRFTPLFGGLSCTTPVTCPERCIPIIIRHFAAKNDFSEKSYSVLSCAIVFSVWPNPRANRAKSREIRASRERRRVPRERAQYPGRAYRPPLRFRGRFPWLSRPRTGFR